MEISETHLSGHRYDIRLPLFGETTPDLFYSRMAEEMIGYVSSTGNVRKYTAVFSAEERGESIFIAVELRARIMSSGGVSMLKKLLRQTWRSGSLTSFSAENVG